ncbi:MAG: ABC transporter ATP-binding protein [Candidatus Kariarchaeaceae archaeon]
MNVIETTDLVKFYGDFVAVDRLNLAVPKGSIFGFLGENGAGKSTTLKMLTGLAYPSHGSVKILDKDISEDRITIASKIGALIESPGFLNYLTGRQALRQLARLQNIVDEDYLEKLLTIVKLQDAADNKISTYSSGMKQRLGLAQALLGEPEIILLDEPFSGLDIQGTLEVKDILIDINKTKGTTILLSSHRLREIDKLCTDVMVIKHGKEVVSGKVDDLITARQKLDLEVSDPKLSAKFLTSKGLSHSITDGSWISITLSNGHTRRGLIEDLNKEGITVYYVSEEKMTLEDFYLEKTAEPITLEE